MIGEGVVIGSNAFIVNSVEENTKVSIKEPNLLYKRYNQQVDKNRKNEG